MYQKQMERFGLSFRFIHGVRGAGLSPEQQLQHCNPERRQRYYHGYMRNITSGELGCTLGHLSIMRTMLANNDPLALITEDDAIFGDDLPEVLDALSSELQSDQPLIILLTRMRRFYPQNRAKPAASHRRVRFFSGHYATGYLITRSGAQRYLQEMYPIWCVCDHWQEIDPFLPVWGLHPYVIQSPTHYLDSEIHQERLNAITDWRKYRHRLLWHPGRFFWHIYRQARNFFLRLIYQLKDQKLEECSPVFGKKPPQTE